MDEHILNPSPEQLKLAPTETTLDPTKKYKRCLSCGQLKEIKSPWKELWKMPTMHEWITLFIIVMVLFSAWAYKHDTQVCRDFIANGSTFTPSNLQIPNYTSRLPDFNNIMSNTTTSASTGGGKGNVTNITK